MCLTSELDTINTLFYADNSLNVIMSKANELVKVFKTKSLKSFKQHDIEKYLLYLKQQGNKNSTINSKLAYLSKCLKYHNIRLIMPYQTVKTTYKNIISSNDFEQLRDKFKDNKELLQFISIAFYTGLRANEILNICMTHLTKRNDTYFINIYDTKNHIDNLIPITHKLNNILDNFEEFTLNYKQIYYLLKKEGVRPHLFRHSFITRCFEKGLDTHTIMRLVNEKSEKSLQSYVHLRNNFLIQEVNKL